MNRAGRSLIDHLLGELSQSNSNIHTSRIIGGAELIRREAKLSFEWDLVKSSDGEISIVVNRGLAQDYSSNGAPFALHTDGLYYPQPPQFALLYCENPGRVAAPTFFLDTTLLLKEIASKDPDTLMILRRLDQVFLGRDGKEFRRPIIEKNPLDGADIMNITLGRAYIRPTRELDGVGDAPHQVETIRAFNKFLQFAEDMDMYPHVWSTHDLIIWDNYRFIHGRGDATGSVGRQLIRAWLSRKSSKRPGV